MTQQEKEVRKLEQQLFAEKNNLIRRLKQFIRDSNLSQEQALDLYDLVTAFYKYGIKNPEVSRQAMRIGKEGYAPEVSMLESLGIEKIKCEHYFDKHYHPK